MSTENGGRETGPSMHEAFTPQTADPMFYAVLEALAETMDDGPMVTTASCQEFLDALNARGYWVRLGPCSPHEWNADGYCMSCGQPLPPQLSMGSLVATGRGLGYVKGMGDGQVLVEMLADEREVWLSARGVQVVGHR